MKPVKILVVTVNEADFEHINQLFEKLPNHTHYRVSWCNNFETAINAMLKQYYQVYLVDHQLGQHTGIDLLNEAIHSNCNEPIIMLTSQDEPEIDGEALKNGAADLLEKNKLEPLALDRSVRYAIEHTRTLKALKESEKKFRMIFERYKDPVLITDFGGSISDLNNAAKQFFGLKDQDINNTDIRKIYSNQADRQRLLDMIQEKGVINDFEAGLVDARGQIRQCVISCFLQISQHGQTEIYHTITRSQSYPLTENGANTYRPEPVQKDTNRLANQIRNPLYNIHLAVDELMVYMDDPDDTLKLYLDIIRSDCKRINQLITDLLEPSERY